MSVTTSGKGELNIRDFLRGLLQAIGTPVLFTLQDAIERNGFHFDWTLLAKVAVSALISYLLMNLGSKPKVIIDGEQTKSTDVETKDGNITVTETKQTEAKIDDKKE